MPHFEIINGYIVQAGKHQGRFEATSPQIEGIGYGETPEEAKEQLMKEITHE
jgi:hypothetical protein